MNGISPQSSSGGGGGMHTSGEQGLQSGSGVMHATTGQQLGYIRCRLCQTGHHRLDVGQIHPDPSLTLGKHQGWTDAAPQL